MPDRAIQDMVIGSGPAGVAVATALLARGRSVTMIDGGKVLEPEALARQQALAAQDPDTLSAAGRTAWQEPQYAAAPGQVRRYGSDFAMEPAAETFAETGGVALRASRAVGGLSNLWGAAVLPYRQRDMAGWPITAADLAPHYRAVAEMMPVAGQADDLSTLFPAFATPLNAPIPLSPQGAELLLRLGAQRDALASQGITAGAARVAVSPGCHRCGLCLHGCPWNLIYAARTTVAALKANPHFHHHPNATVRAVSETGDGVTAYLNTGQRLLANRLFIAAGVLETARIMLASWPELATLTLLDSQQSFLPMLHRWRSTSPPDQPPHTTLPQLFVELDDPAISPHLIHAQIYSWNDHYARDLMANYGQKLPGSGPLWRGLSKRLMVAQLFLHSDHSARIALRRAADGRLIVSAQPGQDAAQVMQAATARLASALAKGGLVALRFARRLGAPGASFHTGGTFPMSETPTARQSDPLGRPGGAQRIHIADASVFPSIPATTITFSAMANAHRIGSLAPE